ncbi:hypothetical protein BDV95DRAFT_592488 [Massariosphaeria phaeospora]|uniref:Uncharacterized protein n=1 Tax=Massariosphaeria phaeospora TaxID=100035 RepID=A0A7C8MQ13_9PLEO|nr:hypothetical protein BDV95DRAFT_592488 [Massariosphaeria phaeospora]
MTTQTSIATTGAQSSLTTSFVYPSTPNTTLSSTTSLATRDTTPEAFPGTNSGQPDATRTGSEGVFNYYFLFLALLAVFIAVGLYFMQRHRKRRKERTRLSGNNALARDLDGWVNTRRWMHGAWRHDQTAAFVRREEGLNEHGEAPPPYQPTGEGTGSHRGSSALYDAASGLPIPLRTLSRDGVENTRPPDYHPTGSRGATITETRSDFFPEFYTPLVPALRFCPSTSRVYRIRRASGEPFWPSVSLEIMVLTKKHAVGCWVMDDFAPG